jgi:hypothetical protein
MFMKWIVLAAAVVGVVIYFKSSKGKALKKTVASLGNEVKEFKHYAGNVVKEAARQGLQYGEDPVPVASRS